MFGFMKKMTKLLPREATLPGRKERMHVPERHFVKYTFLKVDPAWRRLDPDERATHKREFIAACEDYSAERLLRAF